MTRRDLILSVVATGIFIIIATLLPNLGFAQTDKVKAAMADLKARAEKLATKADNSAVEAVAKDHGGVATVFAKDGNEYKRVATTVKKEDGSSAVGTVLDATSPAVAKLNNGEAYYGEATVFGKTYDAGYEPIKDASGTVTGAYFVGQPK
jgi:methyl-accepting chemotaxis protein